MTTDRVFQDAFGVWNAVLETMPRPVLERLQLRKFRRMLAWTMQHSPFYGEKFRKAGVDPSKIRSLDDLRAIPMTDKSEWLLGQGASDLSSYDQMSAVPEAEIVRFHQTSGTTGSPLRLGFNHRDWLMWLECWCYGLAACNLTPADRVLVAFPFNLFVGWWGGLDAARLLGCRVYSAGGMSSRQRLEVIRQQRISVLMGAPSYLLRLAQVARDETDIDLAASTVTRLVCGAEPGGSIAATRQRLEEGWGAEVYDHLGASEVGPWGYECSAHPGGVHACEGYFLLEFLDPRTFEPARPGELSRIVISSLEKYAQPVIRWDLKDLVRVSDSPCPCGRTFRWVQGGILGRADDLMKIRGVLFSPRAVEDVVRSFVQVSDFRVIISRRGDLDELTLRCETNCAGEAAESLTGELVSTLRLKTHLRFGIELCAPGTFPKQEIKTRRLIDLREEEPIGNG